MIDDQDAGLARNSQNNLIRKLETAASFEIGSSNELTDFLVEFIP